MIIKKIKKILESNFWPEILETADFYFRPHDDCDGDLTEGLSVFFSPDGDGFINTNRKELRFRTMMGGGKSPRVRNALLILAVAIKMDNDEGKGTNYDRKNITNKPMP